MKNKASKIDRNKVRTAISQLSEEESFCILYRAIDLLPETKLKKLVSGYIKLEELKVNRSEQKDNLLSQVKEFRKASLQGVYYDEFDVNYNNSDKLSKGTCIWIAECNRLLSFCVQEAKKGSFPESLESFEIIFNLLRHIDSGRDDIVFFADEGGSWQVNVDWDSVFPAWFICLSKCSASSEYSMRVAQTINEFDRRQRDKHLRIAQTILNQEQAAALF